MALKSMTGFGRGEAGARGSNVVVEVSSVNRRQLDVRVGLPEGLGALESRIARRVKGCMSRGYVTCNVSVSRKRDSIARVDVDEGVAEAYVKAMRKAGRRLGLRDDLSLSSLQACPGVVKVARGCGAQASWPTVSRALTQALKGLCESRFMEGKALEKTIVARLDKMEKRLESIRKRAPKVARRYSENVKSRIAKAVGTAAGDAGDLARHVALYAERSDVCEEMERLESHLKHARSQLDAKGSSGRPLDFTCQELLREINTIGSKAGDVAMARHVIAFKSELERMREQVQNVE